MLVFTSVLLYTFGVSRSTYKIRCTTFFIFDYLVFRSIAILYYGLFSKSIDSATISYAFLNFVNGEQIMYEIFAKLLEERGVTPYQVFKATGVAQSSLSDWKNGKSKPKYEKMVKIADYFNVSVDYLLTGGQKNQAPIDAVDEDLRDYLDELRNRPEMRMLFSTTKNATKAQIEAIVKMVEEMQGDR